MRRGQIWWLEHPEHQRRPALILTRDRSIGVLRDVLLAPLTTTIRGIPTEVLLTAQDGVPRECVIDLQHVTTVPKSYLGGRLGDLPATRWPEVCAALRDAIDC